MQNFISCVQPTKTKIKMVESFFEENPLWKSDSWVCNELPFESSKKGKVARQHLEFFFENKKLSFEVKYYLADNLINQIYSPVTVFDGWKSSMKHFAKFINIYYPDIKSIIEVDREKFLLQYRSYLTQKGLITVFKDKSGNKRPSRHVPIFTVLYDFFLSFYDERNETVKDVWDVRKLGIDYNEATNSSYNLDFNKIPTEYRQLIKKYIEQRVIIIQNLTFEIGRRYVKDLSRFFYFIVERYSPQNGLRNINRQDIIDYIGYLRNEEIFDKHTKGTKKITDTYISSNLSALKKFLGDLQMFEWEEAPVKRVDLLIYPEDNPYRERGINRNAKYIPDYIWDKVLSNIEKLKKEYVTIILVMEASGFRASDVLSLKVDCIEQDNDGKWWLVGDQRKVKYKDHKVPISEEIANVIIAQQRLVKEKSNSDNNPKNYLFVRLEGQRKGKPITTAIVNKNLNDMAKSTQILDKDGSVYHFKNHAFRHRYGVNLINNGMSIVLVQRLMAHASPEMTLSYAKIHDQTLRDEYFKAKSQGAIRLDSTGGIVKANIETQAEENGLELEWIRHNFDSIRMDHGVCVKSPKTKCDFLEQTLEPPCIANNCRSFHVDSTFDNFYRSQIDQLEIDIGLYKKQGKERSLQFAQKKKDNYEKILNGIELDGGIYGLSKERREYVGDERKDGKEYAKL